MPEDADLQLSGRPFWSGTITFGLVSVPVNLLPANRSNRTSLRMLSPEGNPLTRRYFAPADDRLLESGDIVRGYEIEKNEFVIVDDDELEKLAPERTRDIDLRVFVPASEIDPIHFERAYYLAPSGGSTKAYRLLARVMEDSDRAGIATFVMRGKEYLVAILAEKGILRAETLRFADEIRTPEGVGLPEPSGAPAAEVKKMTREIGKLAKPKLDTAELEERSAARLHAIVKKKLEAGEDVLHVETDADEGSGKEVLDLVAMLQRSLQGGGNRTGSGGGDGKSGRGGARAAGAGKDRKGSAGPALADRSKAELYERAQELDIPGRSSMTKEELAEAIEGG